MARSVQAIPGIRGLVLPGGWVLDGGDIVVVSDDEWAEIQEDGETLGRLLDLGLPAPEVDQPEGPAPTMRDLQRGTGGATGVEDLPSLTLLFENGLV